MGILTEHYFEVSLAYLDGRKIARKRFRTVQEAMSEAERYVRGHEKVPTGGQVEVPSFGQMKVPTLCSSC